MDESRNIWLHMENSFDGSFMQKVNSWKLNFVVDTRELWLWMEAFFMAENSQWNVLEIWWRSIDKWAKNYGRIVDEIMTPEWLNILLNICAFDEGLQLLKIDEEVRENTDTGGRDFLAERTREEFYFFGRERGIFFQRGHAQEFFGEQQRTSNTNWAAILTHQEPTQYRLVFGFWYNISFF